MKRIIVTQREDLLENELFDSIDVRWYSFLEICGFLPVLIPNHLSIARKIIENGQFKGILLTGGGLISSLGEKTPRDDIEKFLISKSVSEGIPLIGVCRGMQQIQSHFNINLKKIEGHVDTKFEVNYNKSRRIINSYHEYGTEETVQDILVTSRSSDNIIKSISHKRYKIKGIMWHPERCDPFDNLDTELFGKFFT